MGGFASVTTLRDPGALATAQRGDYGTDRVTTQNLEVAKVDVERGLIMVKGAVPGSKGGWVMVRDAAKRPRPDAAPVPASVRKPERNGAAPTDESAASQEGQTS